MKESLRVLRYPALAIVLMLGMQLVGGSIVASVAVVLGKMDNLMSLFAVGLLVSSVLTVIAMLTIRGFGLHHSFSRLGCSYSNAALAFVGILAGTAAAEMVTELMQLPNTMEEQFTDLSQTVAGVLAIGITGPICEELVFRGGVMRPLLREGVAVRHAILLSALIFGINHLNWAQIPFAIMVGVAYGVVYVRTHSLILTSLCHIINNMTAVWLMRHATEGADEWTFREALGLPLMLAVILSLSALCVVLLCLFWRRTQPVGDAPCSTSAD